MTVHLHAKSFLVPQPLTVFGLFEVGHSVSPKGFSLPLFVQLKTAMAVLSIRDYFPRSDSVFREQGAGYVVSC